ncbi:hypothetical protein [Dietzia alimentaria]|uniref:hypothetical protein n=1 Tax=Dietzia alimentaria TaxID=665550 RepID=UPI00029A3F5D|nr:hypothetical protein [Dietzia alimentaria]
MTQEPLNIDPGQVRVHGGILSDAAREADRSLAASREAAAAARAGFPGAAAGPFEAMLVALEASDTALVEAIDRAGSTVGEAAYTYEVCEERNTEVLRNSWVEF